MEHGGGEEVCDRRRSDPRLPAIESFKVVLTRTPHAARRTPHARPSIRDVETTLPTLYPTLNFINSMFVSTSLSRDKHLTRSTSSVRVINDLRSIVLAFR